MNNGSCSDGGHHAEVIAPLSHRAQVLLRRRSARNLSWNPDLEQRGRRLATQRIGGTAPAEFGLVRR